MSGQAGAFLETFAMGLSDQPIHKQNVSVLRTETSGPWYECFRTGSVTTGKVFSVLITDKFLWHTGQSSRLVLTIELR